MTWWTSVRYIYQQGGEYSGGFKGGLQDGRGEYTGQPSFQVQHSISCQAWSRESTKEGRGRQESTGTSHLPPTQVLSQTDSLRSPVIGQPTNAFFLNWMNWVNWQKVVFINNCQRMVNICNAFVFPTKMCIFRTNNVYFGKNRKLNKSSKWIEMEEINTLVLKFPQYFLVH